MGKRSCQKELRTLLSGLDADAGYWKGHCYFYAKDGVSEQNIPCAVRCWTEAAAQGSAKAKYWLGQCHEQGYGMKKNLERANYWYRQCLNQIEVEAQHGDAESQYMIGDCWLHGKGGVGGVDYGRAVRWFRQSADQGNVSALNDTGWCYQHGLGVEVDLRRAVGFYRRAAHCGYSDPQNNLGWCYENELGVPKDMVRAVRWYKKAAKQGNTTAQINLARCYGSGSGVKQDLSRSFGLYEKAATKGHDSAHNDLGWCYRYGEGVKEDHKKAFDCYQKGAQAGFMPAVYNLGRCYEKGVGVSENFAKAVFCYEQAAEQGLCEAQVCLGCCFLHGRGVTKDLKLAVQWFFKAAEQGSSTAKDQLKYAVEHIFDCIYEDRESCARNEAMRALSCCYERGAGVPKDVDLACAWNSEASDEATGTPPPIFGREPRDDESLQKCVCCDERPPSTVLVHGPTGHACCCLSCAHVCKAQGLDCPICRCSIDQIALRLNQHIVRNRSAAICQQCCTASANAAIIHGETSHSGYCFKCASARKSQGLACPMCDRTIDRVILQYVA